MNKPVQARFKPSPIAAALEALRAEITARRERRRRAAAEVAALSRRRFLQAGALSAMAAGVPLLAACGGGGGGDQIRTRTLFFNFSHLDHEGRTMWLQVGATSYRLSPVADMPAALPRERRRNAFLAALDDRHITHAVEGLPPAQDGVVELHYVHTDLGNGQWSMDSFNIALPESGSNAAYVRARARNGSGSNLPLSAKRRRYAMRPAASARDLHEEQALVDTVSHAASLIAMHKDMMALDGSAAHVVVNAYVMQSDGVGDVDDAISQLGSAAPELQPKGINPKGWATLRPVPDANGQPRRINAPGDPMDGHIVYMPVLHPTMANLLAQGVQEVLPEVQNDDTLGADVTARPAGSTLRGRLWARSDGSPTVVQSTLAAATPSAAPTVDVQWPNGQNRWLDAQASVTRQNDGTFRLDASYTNIGLRYLSCYIEFYDEAGQLIKLGTLPGWLDGSWISAPNLKYDPSNHLDDTRLFIGSVASLGTVMGIPVFTDSAFFGSLGITVKLSENVSRVRLYAGGLGTGSNNYPETIAGGVVGTMVMNYVLTILFGTLGAIPDLDAIFSLAATLGSALLGALAAALTDGLAGNDWYSAQFWIDQGMNLLNVLLNIVAGSSDTVLTTFGEALAGLLGAAAAQSAIEKAIPVVGIILQVESALAAVADFALTTVAIAQSPFTYLTDLVLTHDLTVMVNKDVGDTTYPKEANVVTAIATFDDGKPHRMDLPVTTAKADYPSADTPMRLTFKGVPFGGKAEVRVEFHQRASLDGTIAGDILLGAGTTGTLSNDDVTPFTLTIQEQPYPVGPNTRYKHNQRTYLDNSGQHIWVSEPAPTTPPALFPCGSAGQVCQFNGITVRQGTSSTIATMLGYAWRGQNPSGGTDLGQHALLNADTPRAGYAVASDPKGVAGLDIAFSRNAGGTNNFYVDPTGALPMIRGITLDGNGAPSFDAPGSNRAYGMLNLPCDSLLMHPSGALISISGANDRFEVLRPPVAPLTDVQARQQLIAQVVGGSGNLPGRLSQVVAATITKDGTLLMLENGNNRVQALDLANNPVQYFAKGATPYFLPLAEMPTSQGWRHLDIQADFSGLVYLLSANLQTGVYRLSIYDRLLTSQVALTATEGVFAARIGLDHWRGVYTLNYQPISMQSNSAAPAVTEPSVSLWLPCTLGLSC